MSINNKDLYREGSTIKWPGLLELFIQNYQPDSGRSKAFDDQVYNLTKFTEERWRDRIINSLTIEDIVLLMDLTARGQSRSTKKQLLIGLMLAFNFAIKKNFLKISPAEQYQNISNYGLWFI